MQIPQLLFVPSQVKAHLLEKHSGVLQELGEGPDMLFCTLGDLGDKKFDICHCKLLIDNLFTR